MFLVDKCVKHLYKLRIIYIYFYLSDYKILFKRVMFLDFELLL